MVTKKYSLTDLYQKAFNVKVVPVRAHYSIQAKASNTLKELRADKVETIIEGGSELISQLGNKLFMPCELNDEYSLGKFQLPNEPIVEVRGGKRIVKTEIDGMDGTFKELFSLDDYQVTIRGLIVQEDGSNNYPQEAVRTLRDFCELQHEVTINCEITNYFNIAQIVIESWEFPALEGFPGVQPYILNCLSDKDYKLVLNG